MQKAALNTTLQALMQLCCYFRASKKVRCVIGRWYSSQGACPGLRLRCTDGQHSSPIGPDGSSTRLTTVHSPEPSALAYSEAPCNKRLVGRWQKLLLERLMQACARPFLSALPLLLSVRSLTFRNSVPPVWTYVQQGIPEILDMQALEQAHDLTFPWTVKTDVILCELHVIRHLLDRLRAGEVQLMSCLSVPRFQGNGKE